MGGRQGETKEMVARHQRMDKVYYKHRSRDCSCSELDKAIFSCTSLQPAAKNEKIFLLKENGTIWFQFIDSMLFGQVRSMYRPVFSVGEAPKIKLKKTGLYSTHL